MSAHCASTCCSLIQMGCEACCLASNVAILNSFPCWCPGHTIAWTLYFLCKNPAAMARLEAELEEAGLLKSDANPNPREFTFSDIGRLKWLDACIKVQHGV